MYKKSATELPFLLFASLHNSNPTPLPFFQLLAQQITISPSSLVGILWLLSAVPPPNTHASPAHPTSCQPKFYTPAFAVHKGISASFRLGRVFTDNLLQLRYPSSPFLQRSPMLADGRQRANTTMNHNTPPHLRLMPQAVRHHAQRLRQEYKNDPEKVRRHQKEVSRILQAAKLSEARFGGHWQ